MSMQPLSHPQEGCRGPSGGQPSLPRHSSGSITSPFPHKFTGTQPIYMKRMDQALRLPASIAVPQHLNKPPKRNPAPYAHNQRTRFHISQLKDANQLKQAVGRDAQQVLNQLHHLVRQNHDLKQQVTSIREDWTQARKDYSSKREHYENLCAINTAKQVILWKFVARLQGGEFEGGGLKDAKERYESREPGVDGAVESPSGARLENGSQGTIASCLSAMSDLALGSPEQSMTGSTATSLDPNAEIFTPRFPSIAKYYEEPTDSPANIDVSQNSNPLPDSILQSWISTLPMRFCRVCPISLTQPYSCDVANCGLKKLCPKYNDEHGSGCTDLKCKLLHEYRTCSEEIEGIICSYKNVSTMNKSKMAHMNKRVHAPGMAGSEEWRAREVIAALVKPHQDGRY